MPTAHSKVKSHPLLNKFLKLRVAAALRKEHNLSFADSRELAESLTEAVTVTVSLSSAQVTVGSAPSMVTIVVSCPALINTSAAVHVPSPGQHGCGLIIRSDGSVVAPAAASSRAPWPCPNCRNSRRCLT